MKAPDLYRYFRLDPQESSAALGIILAGREADLANQGHSESSPQRRELMTAYSVLSDITRRKTYDDALGAGRDISWEQLEHLGLFNEWPQSYTGWTEPDLPMQPGFSQQQAPFATPYQQRAQEPSPYPNLLGPGGGPQASVPVVGRPTGMADYATAATRPPAGTRFFIAFFDFFLISLMGGGALSPALFANSSFLDSLFSAVLLVLMVAYVVVPEVKWGGSPGKLLFGYRVRDVNTKKNLTYQQSLQRNWFKLVFLIPAVGQVVGFVGAIASYSTINLENGFRGSHDRFADAEVVKKGS